MTHHPIQMSATALALAIRNKDLSSQEVIDAYLSHIEAVNPQINAMVQVVAESARVQAREADAALARGEIRGALHGVPFTAKDVFETAGIISAAGLEERATFVPKADAVVVARMKAAGAILLGKTNCPPGGGGGYTDNPVYGRTNNPYDLTRTPGGSSGGEASAIAAGCSPIGLGSDSGGSIRLPAHFCGIAGLKPTSGRVPNTGTFNHFGGLTDYRTQIGPMARYVKDLVLTFPIIAGEDGSDSGVIPIPLRDPSALNISTLRVAFYTDDGQATPTKEIIKSVQAAAYALQEAGLSLTEALPTCLSDARPITERYWRMTQESGAEVEQMFMAWDRFRTAMLHFMASYDLILCPADYRPASRHDEEAKWRFNYTLPFSLSGWPCVVVRAGTSPEGLPIGVQVVARPWREDVALAAAQVIENALGNP